jgi:MurNAc alpha-1-phosphate uridylyltransferase
MTKPSFDLSKIEAFFQESPLSYKAFAADVSAKQFWQCITEKGASYILLLESRKQDYEATLFITQLLHQAKIKAPQIYAHDSKEQLILFEDLGTYHLGHAYYEQDQTPLSTFYQQATELLIQSRQIDITHCSFPLPLYRHDYFEKQAQLLIDTAAPIVLGHDLPLKAIELYKEIVSQILEQINCERSTFIFRDYFADNLMIKDGETYVIDFQDAGIGPLGYDFISLIEDARYDVPADIIKHCEELYCASLSAEDCAIYKHQKEYIKVIRHLRILSNFLTLTTKGKSGYLKHLPRVLSYLEKLLEQDAFSALKNWFDTYLPFSSIRVFIKKHRPIDQAMILAAGYGKRMRPLTDHTPKPLLPLNGKPILDYICNLLVQNKVTQLFINGHHLADQIKAYAAHQKEQRRFQTVVYSHENTILETAGGVQKMCQFLTEKDAPFFALNGDLYFEPLPDQTSLLDQMRQAWDPEKMDVLLWLVPKEKCFFLDGKGDYFLNEKNRLTRNLTEAEAPYFYAGIQILSPHLFPNTQEEKCYSNLEIWDKAQAENRLFGLIYEAEWFHIGTPEALKETEQLIVQRQKQKAA